MTCPEGQHELKKVDDKYESMCRGPRLKTHIPEGPSTKEKTTLTQNLYVLPFRWTPRPVIAANYKGYEGLY